MIRCAILFSSLLVLLAAIGGCGRSPEEQLAYRHAEEQYQVNQRNAERFRQAEGAARAADEDDDADAQRGQARAKE